MRALLLVPMTLVVPPALFSALQAVTGDALSAIVLGLLLLITLGGWIAGRPLAAGPGQPKRAGFGPRHH